MEHQKILNLLNKAGDSNFVTRKWNIVNDQPNANYDAGNEIIYNIEVLKSNLCDYNDAYILGRGDITIIGDNGSQLAFTRYVTKIDAIDDAGDLDLVMLIYNLLEYSSNYSDMTGSIWFYSKH